MKLLATVLVAAVVAAVVTHTQIAYPAAGPGQSAGPDGTLQVLDVAQVDAAMCVPELWSPTGPATKVGEVLHTLSTTTADPARVVADTQGVLGVLGAWWGSVVAGLRGEAPPASATELEVRAAAVQTARLQAAQVIATACAPCPGASAGVAVGGAGADLARSAGAAAGWSGADLEVAVAIAMAESGGDPQALNTANRNGSVDHGLWQINSVHAGLLADGDWRDPVSNARMAHAVWSQAGQSWTPWVTYKTGAYLAHLSSATPLLQVATAVPPAFTSGAAGCGQGDAAGGVQPAVLGVTAPGGKSVADLVAFARWAQAQGATVGENAALGDPPGSGHSSTGWHYKLGGSGAVDINTRAGESAAEQRELAVIAQEALRLGFGVIFMRAEGDHDGHLHVDVGTHRDVDLSRVGMAA